MTEADRHILAVVRSGRAPTPEETVATIASLEELDAYRVGLSQRGALTTDAYAAIRARQDQLRARGMR